MLVILNDLNFEVNESFASPTSFCRSSRVAEIFSGFFAYRNGTLVFIGYTIITSTFTRYSLFVPRPLVAYPL
jgi:hypothetical protein